MNMFASGIRRAFSAVVAIGATVALVSGCASTVANDGSGLSSAYNPEPLAEMTKVTVAVSAKLELHSIPFLAKEFGEFEKENLDVQFEIMPSSDSTPALAGGLVDVVVGGFTVGTVNAVSAGADIHVIYGGPSQADADGLWVRSDIAALGPAGLKGKRVATSQGAGVTAILPIIDYLASGGLTLADIDLQAITLADLPAALEAGAVDAAWLSSPAHLPFSTTGSATRVVGLEDDQIVTAIFFGPNLRTNNPQVGQAFVRALKRTELTYLMDDYKTNPEVSAALARALDLTVEELRISESLSFGNEITADFFTQAQEAWIAVGDIVSFTEPLAPETYIDTSFIERIIVP
jgi:NitT/TauT family transport system substrate-binding protein